MQRTFSSSLDSNDMAENLYRITPSRRNHQVKGDVNFELETVQQQAFETCPNNSAGLRI